MSTADKFLPQNDILEATSEYNFRLNATSLGILIRDVWEGKVKRIKHGFNNTRYSNLRKRSRNRLHRNNNGIDELTDKTIQDIRSLCTNCPKWLIDSSLSDKRILTLMCSPNFDGKGV